MTESTYFFEPALYDAVYGQLNADLEPLLAEMRGARGRVLEVCCGNGRVLVPAVDAGIACDGLDLDPAMLADCRAKLGGREATLYHADMRDFVLPRRYAMILVAFNSFLHNLTQEDQLATLRTCRNHLEEGGRLLVVIFHPSVTKLLEYAEREQLMFDVALGDGRLHVYDHAADDRIEQVRHVARRLEFVGADGAVGEERRIEFQLRYVFKPEMELLLRAAGFARWTVRPLLEADRYSQASLAGDRPPREGDVLLWTAWKS